MFQYAYIKSLSLKNNVNFWIDIIWFKKYKLHKYCLEVFNIKKKYISKNQLPFYQKLYSKNKFFNFIFIKLKIIFKKINKKHFIEKQFNFDSNFLNIKSWYIEWYFQTEKYFIEYENDIRKDFEFIITPSKQNKKIIYLIHSCNSISIHIRRWDYITDKQSNDFHWTCNLNYYKKAINIINKKVQNPIFFFFSDDIKWVKENLKIKEKSYYIDWNNADTNYEDMRLMSLCKHNIIANSSFSWWWAWLNKNKEKIVIAPSKWFNDKRINYSDIISINWIKI